jgi:hypothetical protein
MTRNDHVEIELQDVVYRVQPADGRAAVHVIDDRAAVDHEEQVARGTGMPMCQNLRLH